MPLGKLFINSPSLQRLLKRGKAVKPNAQNLPFFREIITLIAEKHLFSIKRYVNFMTTNIIFYTVFGCFRRLLYLCCRREINISLGLDREIESKCVLSCLVFLFTWIIIYIILHPRDVSRTPTGKELSTVLTCLFMSFRLYTKQRQFHGMVCLLW